MEPALTAACSDSLAAVPRRFVMIAKYYNLSIYLSRLLVKIIRKFREFAMFFRLHAYRPAYHLYANQLSAHRRPARHLPANRIRQDWRQHRHLTKAAAEAAELP